MNVSALVLLGVAIGFIVLAASGKQDNFIAALKGSAYGSSTLK